jgi:hypothetical protein
LGEDDKKKIEEAVDKLEKLSHDESASAETLNKASEETLQAAQKIGEVMRASAASTDKSGAADESKKDEAKKDDKGSAQEGEVVDE